ncbi:hypothetical protein [Brevundimonas sp. SORGH_AS_0993]|nr:hypothetical protein [Brevundimonas sp. SORGH_AS_0993]MDQ1155168.1 hypothetical protein [Brevundimonas sp. SORGH_AS_0993]
MALPVALAASALVVLALTSAPATALLPASPLLVWGLVTGATLGLSV